MIKLLFVSFVIHCSFAFSHGRFIFHDSESTSPMNPPGHRGEHVLNQLMSKSAFDSIYHRRSSPNNDSFEVNVKVLATPVYIAMNIRSIRTISPSEESYRLRCHLYLLWGVDFASEKDWIPYESLYEKAALQSYYAFSDEETEDVTAKVKLPSIKFSNAKEVVETEKIPSMRLYSRRQTSSETFGVVMWNQGYDLTLSNHFLLHDFPFDHQDLLIDMRENFFA